MYGLDVNYFSVQTNSEQNRQNCLWQLSEENLVNVQKSWQEKIKQIEIKQEPMSQKYV